MLVMLAIWSFSYAMITLAESMELKLLWLKFENIGILTVPIFWFFFAVRYNRLDRWLNPYTAWLFFVIPGVSLVFLFSERWFHLYYASVNQVSAAIGPLVVERGPWYVVALFYAYFISLATIGLLIRRAIQYRNIYRRQMYILIVAALIPILTNIVYQLALSVSPNLFLRIDLTPISFTATAVLIAVGVFEFRIFDLIPIARYNVLEHIPEMVFVIDANDNVVDVNAAAQRALSKRMDDIIGHAPFEVFSAWPLFLQYFLSANETHTEIQIPGDPAARTLEVTTIVLHNSSKQLEGRVIVAHDITEHKRLERKLKFANEALVDQLNEIDKLRAELQEQTTRDPLTNVYNRRYMNEFLPLEIARAEREGIPLSVVIIDADNFKEFNDTYGHKCGDIILQEIATFLVQQTRRSDMVCRFGGEEFVVLMTGASLEIACQRAESWRLDFSRIAIEYDEVKVCATFSAGVAAFPQHGLTDDAILQAADRALYQSKAAGKNQVTMYSA